MKNDKATIGELTAQMVSEAKRLGFSEATIWRGWMPMAGMVVKYYKEQGLCVYDPAVTDEFLRVIEKRSEAGEVSNHYSVHDYVEDGSGTSYHLHFCLYHILSFRICQMV